jgi:site-specific DNA-adenine methylase
MITDLKAPFPYFGGKSTVANVVWQALGQPKHYIEPFAGSCAVLLNRPDYRPDKHMETINDKDGYVSNVWRSLQLEPDAVAAVCDWPVNHADLNARRRYLLKNAGLLQNLCADPEWHDVKMAGYWIWAASCWIGSGLTRPSSMPEVTNNKGVNKTGLYDPNRYPDRIGEKGVHKRSTAATGARPQVGVQGAGIHMVGQIPGITGKTNTGINSQIPLLNHEAGVCRRPCFGASGAHGVHKVTLTNDPDPLLDVRDPYTPGLYQWFRQLSDRLRRVRVVCGDWQRVCGGDWQDDRGTCGMFFDPPYSDEAGRDPEIYHEESGTVAHDVREWCRARGDRKTYRIVLAGYYEEHESLQDDGWTVHRWSAHGGFANKAKDKTKCKGEENRHKEALFFSPHCFSSGLKRFGLEVCNESGSVPA